MAFVRDLVSNWRENYSCGCVFDYLGERHCEHQQGAENQIRTSPLKIGDNGVRQSSGSVNELVLSRVFPYG